MTSTTVQTRALTSETLDLLHKILRLRQVLDARGVEKSQHYHDVQGGLFTPPIKLGIKAAGWPQSEVAALNAARIAGKSNDQIRSLVQQLIAARAALA
jgi:prophage regulatory protein